MTVKMETIQLALYGFKKISYPIPGYKYNLVSF